MTQMQRTDDAQRELLVAFLRSATSANTRRARARDLGIPADWIPGHRTPDPDAPHRGRTPAAPSGLAWLHWCLREQLPLPQARPSDVERWLTELDEAGYAHATRGRMLSTVSAFYRFLLREQIVERNPADGQLVDRRAHHLNQSRSVSDTTPLSLAQCRALLKAAWLLREHTAHGFRDRAMVEILVGTGIRAEELVSLNLDDLRLSGEAALRVHGKGDKQRLVGLPPPVVEAVSDYLARRVAPQVPATVRTTRRVDRVEPVFVTDQGARVHVSHIPRMLRRIVATFAPRHEPRRRWHRELLATTRAGRIGMELRALRETIHPHQLRHSYATTAADRGVDTRQLQRDLGHVDMSTTEVYLHDAHGTRDSAAHDIAPALHRGWLTTRSSTADDATPGTN